MGVEQNYCVKARYTVLKAEDKPWAKKWQKWDLQVENFSQLEDGTEKNSGNTLCAAQVDGAKLQVAPCFLPQWFAGPYWVLEYNADPENGWALISGGAPEKEGANENCKTGTGTNDSGLWIFTRKQERDDALVQKIKDLAEAKGFDTSVLKDTDQTNCASFESAAVLV